MASIINVDQIRNAAGTSGMTLDASTGKASFPNSVTIPNGATMPAGSVLQIVQSISTSHETISTSAWTATNASATITPKSSSSKILVQVTGSIRTYNTGGTFARGAWRLYRDIAGGGYNRVGTHQMSHGSNDYGGSGTLNDIPFHIQYLDNPSTTSAVTYKLYGSHEVGTASEIGPDGDDEQYVTLMEIAQ